MLKNYLVVAIRSLIRNKAFSFINLLGLALGMCCSLLILLWIKDEYSVDAFHAGKDRLYSIYERQFNGDKIEAFHSTPGLMATELKRVFPEVQYASGFAFMSTNTFEVGDKRIDEDGSCADSDFFKMFSYPLLQGDAKTALSSPASIAISRNMATSFFGSPEQAINKTIRYQNRRNYKVTAVFEDLNTNVSQRFDYLINWGSFLDDNPWAKDWNITINNGPRTYCMLRPGINPDVFENKIRHFLDSYFSEQLTRSKYKVQLGIQRFDEMYLHATFRNGRISGGRIEYVKLFLIIAIFILLIACVNFMNLSTARSMKRAKEIGIRKVAGAERWSLILQFTGEAILMAFFAILISLAIVAGLLPAFNNLTHKAIRLPFSEPYFLSGIICLAVITGLISGSYPALFLSSFNPIKVLKGSLKAGPRAALFRKGLVVFQFVLSIILIIGTIVIARQINYIQTMNLGYDKDNVVSVPLHGNMLARYTLFKNEALNIPGVENVTRISPTLPTLLTSGTYDVSWDKKGPDEKKLFIWAAVGYDFIKTLNLSVLQGREFSKDFPTDSSGYILNEAALQQINYTGKDVIGRSLTLWGNRGKIIGVVKDFHFNSLHDPIRPLILRLGENDIIGVALVKIEAGRSQQVLHRLEELSGKINPEFPFSFRFLDEAYQNLYRSEQIIGQLSYCFAFLAIFISCMGLLGLVMFTAEQRTKEIGIRKVLGAGTVSVFTRLSKEFLLLVLLAFFIAAPFGAWAMHSWLNDFAYRVDISWWIFLLAGAIVGVIALVTVSLQAVKAAMANPVRALRSE